MMAKYRSIGALALMLGLLVLLGAGQSQAQLSIHCLDVGQGDCTLVVSPTGGTLLFDGGTNGKGSGVVLPYMAGLGLTALDYVSCSHYHMDHIGGLDEVVNSIGIDSVRVAVLDRGWSYTTQTYNSYANAVAAKRTTILDQQVIDLGGGVTVTCVTVNGNGTLSAPFTSDYYDENDLCVGLLVEYENFEFFVGGDLSGVNSSSYTDIETPTAPDVGDIDIYRVDHHGSSSNSNSTFVSSLDAEVAIISVGSNSYGHPTQTVLNRLVSYGSYIYQTEEGSGGTIPSGEGEVVNGHVVIEVFPGYFTVDGDFYDNGLSGVEVAGQPVSFEISPNPFFGETTFYLSGTGSRDLNLEIYDVQGRLVNMLSAAGTGQAEQALTWDGRTIAGSPVAPGVYFVRLKGTVGDSPKKVVRR
jgi:beta-lactamase superfamily II metal-dependent hydrolase